MNRFQRWLLISPVVLVLSLVVAFTVLGAPSGPILQVSPPAGAAGVWLGTPIDVTFGLPMDRASVESRLAVEPAVAGKFVWRAQSAGVVVEFLPDDVLAGNTKYTVTLQPGIRDVRGNVVLDAPYVWSFTTEAARQTISFGTGLPVQLVDPGGRNAVRIWPGFPRITLKLALYVLPPAEFVARYGKLDRSGSRPIEVANLEPLDAWYQSFQSDRTESGIDAKLRAVAPGIYVLVASHPSAGQDELIVVVSRHVLALKRGTGDKIVAWAVALGSQEAAEGMAVTLYDAQAAPLADGTTNALGVVELSSASARSARLAVGRLDGTVTVAGIDGAWRTDGGYWYWWGDDWSPVPDPYRVYLYTDRPIYRPGDTVHFAAILRRDADGTYTPVAASVPVTVTLRDSRDNVVATRNLAPDDFGSVGGDFTLAAEPPMGQYNLEMTFDGTTRRQAFRVEAYRKPEYKVDVTTPAAYAVAGDSVPVTVQADYYFGQPVGGADVVLKVFRRAEWGWWWPPYDGEQVAELRGKTDAAGRWVTNFASDDQLGRNAIYTFVATVADATNQPVEGRVALPVQWNTFRLALSTEKYGYSPAEPIVARLEARRHDAAPVAGLPVTVSVWRDYPESETVASRSATTDGQGRASVTLDGLPQGWYRVLAEAVDERTRRVEATTYLWIYDREATTWWYSTSDDLSISADRDRYNPGDTAHLLIQSRVTGRALVTLERGDVYTERVVRIDGPATTVEVPVDDSFAPNVFARVHLFKPEAADYGSYASTSEGRLLTAQAELVVSADSRRLQVAVTPDSPKVRPGSRVTFTLVVSDAGGSPVEAQVGLALVDEAIFALSEDMSANLFDTFYGTRYNQVVSYDSLVPRRYHWSERTDVPVGTATPSPAPTGTPVPGRPPEEKTGSQPIRQEFRDTAYWNPDIRTGPDGRAVVTVDLPDNLTTWRVIARAVTLDTRVGDATTSILATQDIVARPALPRFAVLGDQLALDVVAQNFSGQPVTGTATLDAPALEVLDAGPRTLPLPNLGTAVAHWSVVAAEVGAGTFTTTLTTPAGGDGVAMPLRTKPFAVPERWSAAGRANLVALEHFSVPFNAVGEASGGTLRLSPSVALGVLDGLDALIDYPYGCVEQTMSRVLPGAAAARAYRELGIPNPKAEELPEIVRQGLQRLYGFQHDDGSWGWWYDDADSVYLTAYVLFGLTTVQQAGFDVDATVLSRGFSFLDSRLPVADDPRVTAYALYVKSVAGRGDVAAARALVPAEERLDPFARAALTLALAAGGDPADAQRLVDILASQAVESASTAYWPMESGPWSTYHWRTLSSSEKNTAMALRALVALRPDHPLLTKAVRWLMDHRRGAGWQDTQSTAFAVLGLVDSVRVLGEIDADYSYTVTLNGEQIAAGRVTPQTVTQPIAPVAISGSDLQADNELRIERSCPGQASCPGQLYYSVALDLELFYDGFEPVSSIDGGLVVNRTYRRLDASQTADGIYRVGDIVEVAIDVEARDEAWHVIVEDNLPAGFEALNERLNPVVYGDVLPPMRWYEWGYNRKDIYDDRVVFFTTQLWHGKHTFTYRMRATTPGEFGVLPAQAYPMYSQDTWGRSASQRVTVAPDLVLVRPALAGDFDRDCRVTDFDTRQVAGAWGTQNGLRDVDRNGLVDLRDLAVVASREGATCRADRALPGASQERASLAVAPGTNAVPGGGTFEVNVSLTEGTTLSGFELTLSYDPARVRVVDVRLDPALGKVTLLGPRVARGEETRTAGIGAQSGTVALGAFGVPEGLPAGTRLAVVTFAGLAVGEASLGVEAVQAVDAGGRTLAADARVDGHVTVGRTSLWFPVVGRADAQP